MHISKKLMGPEVKRHGRVSILFQEELLSQIHLFEDQVTLLNPRIGIAVCFETRDDGSNYI